MTLLDRHLHRPWPAMLAICLIAAPARSQPAAPEPAPAPSTDAALGSVAILVFGLPDSVPLAGVHVRIADAEATTNENGAANLVVAPGTRALRIEVPAEQLPEGSAGEPAALEVPDVPIAPGETTQVILTVTPRGALGSSEIEAPKSAAAKAEQQAASPAREAQPQGVVRGRALSIEDQAPIAGARVFVRGEEAEAETDAEGRFTLTLPAGTHTLSVIHTKFSTQTIDSVVVEPDASTQVVAELSPASLELEEYVVVAPHIEGTVAQLMDERRATAAVTDAIGAEDIARMPASDAAQAAQRVVGATIVGGRFVYVRGLGERYTNAQLNGAPLPSPEPDRSTVPLDLFPAQILDSLDISKTFTPDVPADFAGGSVRIVTRAMPEKPAFTASLSLGANTQSTFKSVLGPDGRGADFLGFDDGTRALSSEIPDDYELNRNVRKPDGERVTDADLDQAGRELNSRMSPVEQVLLPNGSGSVMAGSSWKLDEDARVGVIGSLVYRRNFSARREVIREYDSDPNAEGGLKIRNRYDKDAVSDEVRWGAFASTALDLSEHHRLVLLGMHSQLSDNSAELFLDGFNDNTQSRISSNRLLFVSRSLDFGQLQGQHGFPWLNDALLEWNLSLALAQRAEPDRRDVVYQLNTGSDQWSYLNGSESGRHFFAAQDEISRGAGIDWTQPLTSGDFATKLKVGSLVTLKDRELRARRFVLRPVPRAPLEPQLCGVEYDPVSCPDELFVDENIGSVLRLEEGTRKGDSYNAGLNVIAGYALADVGIGEHIRLLAGARVEKTEQTLVPYDEFVDEELEDNRADLERVDLLPAVSLVYRFSPEVALRLAGSRTLARPQLRELAPFAFSDYFNGIQVTGNPDLDLTTVLNGDLRLEYFPTPREVLAISLFAKDFTDPIEPIIKPGSTADVQAYENSPGARLYGVEVEARKGLGFLSDALDEFTVIGSFMIAASDIEVRQTGTEFLTHLERPLVHQAPYVINLALDYENDRGTHVRALYNLSGPTLVEIGVGGLDDAYLQPKHLVDVTASQALDRHFRLRLSIQNLLDAEHLVTQGKDDRGNNLRYQYREGVAVSLGLSYAN